MILEMGAIPTVVAMDEKEDTQAQVEDVFLDGEGSDFDSFPMQEELYPEDGMLPYGVELYANDVATFTTTGFGTVSGTCGDKLTWTLVESTGVLTISGTGDMEDYSLYSVPWYSYQSSIVAVEIGSGVTSICNYAFRFSHIQSVIIPDGVLSVGNYAFYGCVYLKTVTFPDSITSFGGSVLGECSSLISVRLPSHIDNIPYEMFNMCISLPNISIPQGVTSINNRAFRGCESMTSISIPNSVSAIGEDAFFCCTSLTDVYYSGSQAEWNAIFINSDDNSYLTNATIHYHSTMPDDGNESPLVPVVDGTVYALTKFDGDKVYFNGSAFGCDIGTGLDSSGWADLVGEYVIVVLDTSGQTDKVHSLVAVDSSAFGYIQGIDDNYVTISGTIYPHQLNVPLLSTDFPAIYHVQNGVVVAYDMLFEATGTLEGWNATTGILTIDGMAFRTNDLTDFYSIVPFVTESLGQEIRYYRTGYGNYDLYFYQCLEIIEEVIPEFGNLDFNSYIFRANFLNSNEFFPYQVRNDIFYIDSPSQNYSYQLSQPNFWGTSMGDTAATWEALTASFDAALDATTAVDYFRQEDMYVAMIMSALESQQDSFDTSVFKDLSKALDLLVKSVEEYYLAEFFVDISNVEEFQKLNVEQKGKILTYFNDQIGNYFENPELVAKVFSETIWIIDSISEFSSISTGLYAVYSLSDSSRNVFEEMKAKSTPNSSLSKALDECIEIMYLTEAGLKLEILSKQSQFVAETVYLKVASEFWKSTVVNALSTLPGVKEILAAYKVGKFISNVLFNTDETVEKYFNMLVISEIENLLESATYSINNQFKNDGNNEELAKTFLAAVELAYTFRDEDVTQAYKFVDEIDDSLFGWISEVFSGDVAQTKEYLDNVRGNYIDNSVLLKTTWVYYLTDTDLYEYYMSKLEDELYIQTELSVACPVDVSVYDSNDILVLEIINNEVESYSSNVNMIIKIVDDVKTIEFYDKDEYTIVYSGNDTGTMDISIKNYDENEELARTVVFYNVDLTDETEYTSVLSESEDTIYELQVTGSESISHDYDSKEVVEKYSISIDGGYMVLSGVTSFETEASSDEKVDITAFIPDGYTFINWTADSNQDAIKESTLSSTSLRMPSSDIELTANLQREKATITAFDMEEDNGKITACVTVEKGTSEVRDVSLTVEIDGIETSYPMSLIGAEWQCSFSPKSSVNMILSVSATDEKGYIETSSSKTVYFDGTDLGTVYNILFDTQGGVVPMYLEKTDGKGLLTSLPVTEKGDNTFNGWFTLATGGEQVSLSTVFTENTTLYAQWTKNSGDDTTTEGNTTTTTPNTSGGSSSSSSSSSSSGSTTTDTEDDSDSSTDSEDATENSDNDSSETQKYLDVPQVNTLSQDTLTDLDTSAWFYEPVKFAYEHGLMSGTGDGNFSPQMETSRAMIVQVIYNIAGQPYVIGTDFSDVPSDAWYTRAVAWASAVGVARGIGNNEFNSYGNMTREQLVVMLYGFEKLLTKENYTGSTALSFNDTSSFNSWGIEATAWAVSKGIVAGKPNGGFDPQASATRAEVAQILKNFVEVYS